MKKIEWIAFKLKDREAVQWTPKSKTDRTAADAIYEALAVGCRDDEIGAFVLGAKPEGGNNKLVCVSGTPRNILPLISKALGTISAFVEDGEDDEEDEE